MGLFPLFMQAASCSHWNYGCLAPCSCLVTCLTPLRHIQRRLCADTTCTLFLSLYRNLRNRHPPVLLLRNPRLKFPAQGHGLKCRWEPEPQLFWTNPSLGCGGGYLIHDCHLCPHPLATSCCWGAEAASSWRLPLLPTPASITHSAPSSPHPSPQKEPAPHTH